MNWKHVRLRLHSWPQTYVYQQQALVKKKRATSGWLANTEITRFHPGAESGGPFSGCAYCFAPLCSAALLLSFTADPLLCQAKLKKSCNARRLANMTNGLADILPQRFQSQEQTCSLTLPAASRAHWEGLCLTPYLQNAHPHMQHVLSLTSCKPLVSVCASQLSMNSLGLLAGRCAIINISFLKVS